MAHTHGGMQFEGPENQASFTTRQVMELGLPILLVSRAYEDSAWQFLCGTTNHSADLLIVCLGCVVEKDPTLNDIADLPPGWQARRDFPGGPWTRIKNHPYATFDDDGYYLLDAVWLSQSWPPGELVLPSSEEITAIQPGDFVKAIFRFAPEQAESGPGQCERMWIEMTEYDEDYANWRGTLANDPSLSDAISFGAEIVFYADHIIAIQSSLA